MMAMLDPPVPLASAPRHLAERLPPDPLIVIGDPPRHPCGGSPISASAYRATLEQLYQDTLVVEESELQFQELLDSAACLAEPVDPWDLARVHFLQAMGAWSDGEMEAASRAFERVFVVDPEHAWDPDYPPPAQHLFIDAAAAVGRLGRAQLTVLVPAGLELRIDGRPQAATGAAVVLAPGRHLVQVRDLEGGVTRTVSLSLAAGEGAVVLDARGLERGFAPAGALASSGAPLLREAADAGGGAVYLVSLAPEIAVWSLPSGQQTLATVVVPPSARSAVRGLARPRSAGPKADPALPILLASGAGLAAAGAIVVGIQSGELRQFNGAVEAGDIAPFPMPDDPDPSSYEHYREWERITQTVSAGYGLLAAGGTLLVVAIPVGAAKRDGTRAAVAFRPSPTSLQISVALP